MTRFQEISEIKNRAECFMPGFIFVYLQFEYNAKNV